MVPTTCPYELRFEQGQDGGDALDFEDDQILHDEIGEVVAEQSALVLRWYLHLPLKWDATLVEFNRQRGPIQRFD